MKTRHIKKIKPLSKPLNESSGSAVKTRETGLACIPTGEPPVSSL